MQPDSPDTASPDGLAATLTERLQRWLYQPDTRDPDTTAMLILDASVHLHQITATLELAELTVGALQAELAATTHPDPAPAGRRVAGVIGLGEPAAIALLADAGFAHRIVSRDGDGQIITTDFRSDRVNLTIDGGIVTHAHLG